MQTTPVGALAELLASLGDEPALRELLGKVRGGPALLRNLPEHTLLSTFARDAAEELHERELIDPAFFDLLLRERPARGGDIRRVSALWVKRGDARRRWVGAGVVSTMLVGVAGWVLLPPRDRASSEPTDPFDLTVVIFDHEAPVLPADAPLADRRKQRGELLAALVAAGPRAVVLDFYFQPDPAADAALDTLKQALEMAHRAKIPVLAVENGPSAIPWCPAAEGACFDLPLYGEGTDGLVSTWVAGRAGRPTVPWALASLLLGWNGRTELPYSVDTVPVPAPPSDPCDRGYRRLWASEVLNQRRLSSYDPLSGEAVPTRCSHWAGSVNDLIAGKVLLVGDARATEEEGPDEMKLGSTEDPVEIPAPEGLAWLAISLGRARSSDGGEP